MMKSKPVMKCLCAALLLVSCLFAGTAECAKKTVVVAVDGDWPPMKMKDDKGNLAGYEIDMIRAIADEAGFEVSLVEVPWDAIFEGLDALRYDAVIASVSITDKRKGKYDFSAPYISAGQLLVVPKSLVSKPLAGKVIAAFEATTGEAALKGADGVKRKVYPAAPLDSPFKDLAEGAVSGVLCDVPVAVHYAFYEKAYKGKFAITSEDIILGKPSAPEDYGIVVRKGNAEILEFMNKGIKGVKSKDTAVKLRMKWISW